MSDKVKPNEKWESVKLDETHETMLGEIDRLKNEIDRLRGLEEREGAIERAAAAFVRAVEAGDDADPLYEALGRALGIEVRPAKSKPAPISALRVVSVPGLPSGQVALVQPVGSAPFSFHEGEVFNVAGLFLPSVGSNTVSARPVNALPACPGPDCLMCNGSACNKCGAGCWGPSDPEHPCEHDVIERHESGVEKFGDILGRR
jgi:hypothetical protein